MAGEELVALLCGGVLAATLLTVPLRFVRRQAKRGRAVRCPDTGEYTGGLRWQKTQRAGDVKSKKRANRRNG